MNADRKLISQPSVDSENNERVSTDRVGSFPFHALQPISHNIRVYTQRILHCTRIVCDHRAHCLLYIDIFFSHSYLFISFLISITFLFLFVPFFFFNFWHRLFQANVKFSRFPVCVLSVVSWKMQTPREWNGIFFLFLFFLMKNKRCEVQFGKIDFKGLVCWKRRHFYYLSFIGTNRYIRFYSYLHKIL